MVTIITLNQSTKSPHSHSLVWTGTHRRPTSSIKAWGTWESRGSWRSRGSLRSRFTLLRDLELQPDIVDDALTMPTQPHSTAGEAAGEGAVVQVSYAARQAVMKLEHEGSFLFSGKHIHNDTFQFSFYDLSEAFQIRHDPQGMEHAQVVKCRTMVRGTTGDLSVSIKMFGMFE